MSVHQTTVWPVRCGLAALAVLLVLGCAFGAQAAPAKADPAAVAKLLGTLKNCAAQESPTVGTDNGGFVRFLAAPPGGSFSTPASVAKQSDAEAAARAYWSEEQAAFGVTSANVSFRTVSKESYNGFTYIRLQQQYNGVDVLAGQVVLQVNAQNEIVCVSSELLTDTRLLDDGSLSVTPSVSASDALESASHAMSAKKTGAGSAQIEAQGAAKLLLLQPALIGTSGPLRLVWSVPVGERARLDEALVYYVDASAGAPVFNHELNPKSRYRAIGDLQGQNLSIWYSWQNQTLYMNLPDPVRVEGDPAVGISGVDDVYDYLGDSYDFFFSRFGRDSFDGLGSHINAWVNANDINAGYMESLDGFVIGRNITADDVIAHEFTHAVTGRVANLVYYGESGALSESYSDIFGEFIDMQNGHGNDATDVRWLMGEDLNFLVMGVIRSMSDPTWYGDPDRRYSPNWQSSPFIDNAGVHTNSGVGNKTCYLVTDGDFFNGYTVTGVGEERAAQLFYAALYLMTPGTDYNDWARCLSAAAVAQNWTYAERLNLANILRATEIEPPSGGAALGTSGLTYLRAIPTQDSGNSPVIALTWKNPLSDMLQEVTLLRSVTGYATDTDSAVQLANGTIEEYLDSNVQPGVQYYYTVVATMINGITQIACATAVADTPMPAALAEVFDAQHPLDLDNTQLTFTPVGAISKVSGDGVTTGDLSNYEVTIKRNVTSFPVVPADGDGTQYTNLGLDAQIQKSLTNLTPFPFFGRMYTHLFISANGYISFAPVESDSAANLPSFESHYVVPRISFLFSRLATNTSGRIWMKWMDDRLVITFENVSEYVEQATYNVPPNSVQVELFHSGHIRMTYLNLGATTAIVGLSDGRGALVSPSEIFDGLKPVPVTRDLTTAPQAATRLSLDPIAPQWAYEGSTVTFTAHVAPAGTAAALTATWNGSGPAPFADNGDGTGTFSWTPGNNDSAAYTVHIEARTATDVAAQDVHVTIYNQYGPPEAIEVGLGTDAEDDDPYQSRIVDYGRALHAIYTYTHSELLTDPDANSEGVTLIYWYKNDELVSAYTGVRDIPATGLAPNDRWYFEVIPVTKLGVVGDSVRSPVVTIAGEPIIDAVIPPYGLTTGGETVRIRGLHLSGPMRVNFGGVLCPTVRMISDEELEVVTPVYAGNTQANANGGDWVDVVDVTVETVAGSGYLPDAFTYKADKGEVITGEIPNAFGCGLAQAPGDVAGSGLAVLAALLWARRRRPAQN